MPIDAGNAETLPDPAAHPEPRRAPCLVNRRCSPFFARRKRQHNRSIRPMATTLGSTSGMPPVSLECMFMSTSFRVTRATSRTLVAASGVSCGGGIAALVD